MPRASLHKYVLACVLMLCVPGAAVQAVVPYQDEAVPAPLAAMDPAWENGKPGRWDEAVSVGKSQQLTSPDQVPDGLAPSDWRNIRAAYEAGRYAFHPTEKGWQARNPGQQWLTTFDKRGFLAQPKDGGWQWGLELRSYGFGDRQHVITGPPAVQADGQRLGYQWDAIVQEWFVNDARGLEHGFTVTARPAKPRTPNPEPPNSLSFLLATRGDLRPRVTADERGVEFLDAAGDTVLTYANLRVWDADGQILPSWFAPHDPRHPLQVTLTVNERGARYPLTIDPLAQQTYLKASNIGTDDFFGYSVMVAGDTVVVGAPGEASNATGVNGNQASNSAPDSGAVYVFTRSAEVWTQQAYLKASNTEAFDYFGVSVAVAGDTVVVGAYLEDSNATGVNGNGADNSAASSGAAYIFTRSAGVWTQEAYLKASNSEADDFFGFSVAVAGDTVVVGAVLKASNATGVNGNADNLAASSGAACVFTRSAGVWTQQASLEGSKSEAGDYFGISVAVAGDTVVVGAYNEDSSATGVNGNQADNSAAESGAAYVFTRSAGVWTQEAYLKASNSEADDFFGISVAVAGDTVVVGAPGEASNATGVNSNQADNSALNSGAAYVFTRSAGVWTQEAYLKASNTGAGDFFGVSVAVAGDTVAVGAYQEGPAVNSGAAYVFTRSTGVWTQEAYLKADNSGADDFFGVSVAVAGDMVVIGAFQEANSATRVNRNQTNNSVGGSGAVYLFTAVPEIAVSGNSMTITDGDTTPSLADHTDFGSVHMPSGTIVRTFTITNTGPAVSTPSLTVGSVTVNGPAAADFTVILQPTSPVSAGGSTTFQVALNLSAPGLRSATLSFNTNDADETPFNFSIQGAEAGVTVTPTLGLLTTEVGGTATFTVVLDGPPAANVTIALSSSNLMEGTVAPASLAFTPGNWNSPQLVTITGVRDGVLDGDIVYTILMTVTSTDPIYHDFAVADVSVTNRDDGEADLAITKTDGVTTVVPGQVVTYTITGSNAGPGATTATVADTFPVACGSVSWMCTGTNGGSCTASGSGALTDAVILPSGGSVTYTATCTMMGVTSRSLTNTVTIASSNDPNASNNSATDTDTIACTYTLTPLNQVVGAGATAMQVDVTTQTACAWTAVSQVPWITITGDTSGSSSGTVGFSVAANAGPNPRRGAITIAGKTLIVSQQTPVPAPCIISASAPGSPIAASGGTGSVTITASTGSCAWSATSHVAWITLTAPVSGSGNGAVAYTVAANTPSNPRKGRIIVNGKRVTISQD